MRRSARSELNFEEALPRFGIIKSQALGVVWRRSWTGPSASTRPWYMTTTFNACVPDQRNGADPERGRRYKQGREDTTSMTWPETDRNRLKNAELKERLGQAPSGAGGGRQPGPREEGTR